MIGSAVSFVSQRGPCGNVLALQQADAPLLVVTRYGSVAGCLSCRPCNEAGDAGLNLTAASHVIHFDYCWNPAVKNQATDRAFRIAH